MRATKDIMGMPITVDIADALATEEGLEEVFSYFIAVDKRFSTYKPESEIMRINRGELVKEECSDDMREIFKLAEKTKKETGGYFDIKKSDGTLDPSGVVKGWAILNAAEMLRLRGFEDFYVDAGGDIASNGKNAEGEEWNVGIRNPFNRDQIVKVIYPRGSGVATSGTYIRGQHIYDPHAPNAVIDDIVSLTVIGPDVLEADRFATAAFAMGMKGLEFLERLPGFEAYAIDPQGIATMTSGFDAYTRTA
jgi:thiamine biosynthesis lipoprotein